MIGKSEALACCVSHFPRGPERLAELLHVSVREASLKGCDGWCLRRGTDTIITLNGRDSARRRRFTLAHELAHLVLGTTAEVVVSSARLFSARAPEEKGANALAAEMLLPPERLAGMIKGLPIGAPALRRVAGAANVSEVMAACRVASLSARLGLKNAAVAGFVGEKLEWVWSSTLRVAQEEAVQLLRGARAAGTGPFRVEGPRGVMTCASVISARGFEALFVQRLPRQLAGRKTPDERRKEIEASLFAGDAKPLHVLNGRFGYFKGTMLRPEMSVEQAVRAFLRHYRPRSSPDELRMMDDPRGREWLRIKCAAALSAK